MFQPAPSGDSYGGAGAAGGDDRPPQSQCFPDFDLDPEAPPDPRDGDVGKGTVHPLTGPVHIEGSEPGDVLKV